MTNVLIDQWNKMYKLISQHKFTLIDDVNDDYKCGICKNILTNAHQAICGCDFCYECITQYMANGAVNCPNNTEECKLETLSNIVPNHFKNKLISKLIVRCSNKMCSHECKLIEMENHLNACLNQVVKCPFNDFGCEHFDMINDKLNDHMLSDIHNHNKILIDFIGNLRNEMRELTENNRIKNEILTENDRIKNEIIESLKEEIKSIKKENKNLAQQMEIGNQNLWYKFDEIDIEIKNKSKTDELLKEFDEKFDIKINTRYFDMKEELNEKLDEKIKKMKEENEKLDIEITNKIDKLIKQEIKDMAQQMEIGNQNLWYKFDEIDIEMKNKYKKEELLIEFDEIFDIKMKKMREENENLDIEKLNNVDKYLNVKDDGRLEWQIGKINEIKWMRSEYFFDKQNPYKMNLRLRNINNELNIWLCIHSAAFDDDLKWPCQADVTIYIYALNDLNKSKAVTKSFKIEKPKSILSECDDPIKISHYDLTKINLNNISCLMDCFVKFK